MTKPERPDLEHLRKSVEFGYGATAEKTQWLLDMLKEAVPIMEIAFLDPRAIEWLKRYRGEE